MTEETFNPEDHMWSFTGYYKFEFSFCTVDAPHHYANFGGFSDDIYDYHLWAGEMSYAQITDGGTLTAVWKDWED